MAPHAVYETLDRALGRMLVDEPFLCVGVDIDVLAIDLDDENRGAHVGGAPSVRRLSTGYCTVLATPSFAVRVGEVSAEPTSLCQDGLRTALPK